MQTKTLPTIDTYGHYSNENYGAHALRVDVGPLALWYSYKTVIAFQLDGKSRRVSVNEWGPTTGKHLNAIDGGYKKDRLPRAEFEAQLSELLTSLGLGD